MGRDTLDEMVCHNIRRVEGQLHRFCASSDDPQFELRDLGRFANGWIALEFNLAVSHGVREPVTIYQDFGNGYSEETSFRTFPDSHGRAFFAWKAAPGFQSLRLDPISHPGEFELSALRVYHLSRLMALWKLIGRFFAHQPGRLGSKVVAFCRLIASQGPSGVRDFLVREHRQIANAPFSLRPGALSSDGSPRRSRADSRAALLEEYVREGFLQASTKVSAQPQYVPRSNTALASASVPIRAIAFYLPQFHPFPENDIWWGKGFTEWTNVSKAKAQYVGHYQPRLPGEFGFYDLRLPEIMHRQAALARQYGIYGFCFHHYWFAGKRLMDLPMRNLLGDPEVDIKFCVCWANENWSRRWDGSESDILIAQRHSPEDDIAFFEDLLPALQDPRYIRIDGKPVLIVYRISLLPEARQTAARWRARALECGLPGLFLVVARSFEIKDPRPYGFDAAVEFPPHQVRVQEVTEEVGIVNEKFSGRVFDYGDLAAQYSSIEETEFVNFKTVVPSWDNEARKPGGGQIYHGSTPDAYAKWLFSAARMTLKQQAQERLLFVNAWNEWAEGAYLEPDRQFGYAYLQATASTLGSLK